MVRNANDELQEDYYYIVEEYDFVPDNASYLNIILMQ